MKKLILISASLLFSVLLFSFTSTRSEVTETVSVSRTSNSIDVSYGGTASVRVKGTKNGKTETKTLNASTLCYHKTKSAAKSNLRSHLSSLKGSYWEFDSPIYYDIDTCD